MKKIIICIFIIIFLLSGCDDSQKGTMIADIEPSTLPANSGWKKICNGFGLYDSTYVMELEHGWIVFYVGYHSHSSMVFVPKPENKQTTQHLK